MKSCLRSCLVSAAFLWMALVPAAGLANQAAVKIDAPEEAARGDVVVITINVMHDANLAKDHVNWVWLKLNGRQVRKWVFTREHLPESNNFSLKYQFIMSGDTTVSAEGNCIMHGSAGPDMKKIIMTK
jgi:hypothetical protein